MCGFRTPKRLVFVCSLLLVPLLPVHALEFNGRLKWFGSAAAFPDQDLQRIVAGTPAYDSAVDLRLMFQHRSGAFEFLLDHSILLLSGDTTALGQDPSVAIDQTVTSDEFRGIDLTWDIEDGGRHRSLHRLDRLALRWQPGDWSLTLGRQAVSWGSGIVFQPLDLFSPFSPTVVDRDYKAGDDLLLIDRLLPNGQDLQLLHVVRRDGESDISAAVASTAFKWHGYAGAWEIEALIAEHFDERVLGLSLRVPLGLALLRTDIVATRAQLPSGASEWRVSGIANADVTFNLGQRNAYAFVEYFHNAWGVDQLPDALGELPAELSERLLRGEIFNLMRDYVAVGGNLEWHPLVSQSLTFISNLHDSSTLLQTQLTYSPTDHQTLQVGWIESLGRSGDEFGGIPVGFNPSLPSMPATTGGASRFYLRWVYFL